jgi:hypothetical protein
MASMLESNKGAAIRKLSATANGLTLVVLAAWTALGVALYILSTAGDGVALDANQRRVAMVCLPIALLCFLIFHVMLGIQAKRLKSSPIVWVGLSVLTAPFGPLLACLWIRDYTRKACKEIALPRKEMNRVAEEGDKAFQAGLPMSANPYISPDTAEENAALADFWNRGYQVAAKRVQKSPT